MTKHLYIRGIVFMTCPSLLVKNKQTKRLARITSIIKEYKYRIKFKDIFKQLINNFIQNNEYNKRIYT